MSVTIGNLREWARTRAQEPALNDGDPPPMNWSILIVRNMEEDPYGEEDLQAGRDRGEAASG